MKKIPLIEPDIGFKEKKIVNKCLDSKWISSRGNFVKIFEKRFEKILNTKYAVATSNGTVALELALLSLGIKKNDEIIVPNLTFAATANAVLNAGAKLKLCDVDPDTWNISIENLKKLITNTTKAIIVVHLYGQPFDIRKLNKILKNKKILIIEDCAEAIGSHYYNHHVGYYSDAATFSFFGNKTITTGEGGMVLFKNKKNYNLACKIRNNGMNEIKKYWHDIKGSNFKLTNIQAAIGIAQIDKLNKYVKKKNLIARNYKKLFNKFKLDIKVPINQAFAINSYWLFTILINNPKKRDKLIKFLKSKGIDSRPLFYPLSLMKPYHNKVKRKFSNSVDISKRGVSLPSSYNLSFDDQAHIVKNIKYFLDNK